MELNDNRVLTLSTTTSTQVSNKKNKPSYRSSIIVINTSTGGQKVTLAIDKGADVDGEGIQLSPGGFWIDTESYQYLPTQEIVNAKADVVGATLSIQERMRS